MLGMPISLHYDSNKEFRVAIGGVWSVIRYSIMAYVLVYLSIECLKDIVLGSLNLLLIPIKYLAINQSIHLKGTSLV